MRKAHSTISFFNIQLLVPLSCIQKRLLRLGLPMLLLILFILTALSSAKAQETPPVPNVPTALSGTQNYIATWTATAPITDPNVLVTRPLSDVKLSVQYFDGLGRPTQTVLKQGSLITATAQSADLITQTLYDDFGRNYSTLLPYAATDGADGHFRPNAEAAQIAWYNSGTSPVAGQGEAGADARSLTVFEASPLNRVLESFAPGKSWVGSSDSTTEAKRHSVKQKYWINTATDAVRIWNVSYVSTPGAGFGTYTNPSPATYPAGTLYKNVTQDEQNRQVIEFIDKDGHTILKKVQLSKTDNGTGSPHTGWLCTYYLYDDFGNLRCVIQPEGVKLLEANNWSFTNTVGKNLLKEQCFRYEYDGRNRMIIKQVPGAGPVYMVYDNRDRLVMTQDSTLRVAHKWLTTRYDNLNRPDTTWLYSTTGSFTSILAAAADTTKYPYTNPTAATILTETHYDSYDNLPALPTGMTKTYNGSWDSNWLTASTSTFPYAEKPAQNSTITTKGLVTWTRVKVLDSTLTLASIHIYDDKGRLIQTQSQNITGGIDVTSTQYSWAGWPLVTVQKQEEKKGGSTSQTQTTVVVTKMTYDDLGRVVKTEMKQSNSKVAQGAMSGYATISEVGYDALGQVKTKKIGKRRNKGTGAASDHITTPLESQDYDYNIRGWLLGVNRAYVKQKSTTDSLNTATTTGVISGEMFTESSADLQVVTFPSSNYFGFDLGYDQRNNNRINSIPYDSARYDGNITGMTWKGANDRKIRKYDFGYDPVSRLTKAKFGQLVGSSFSTTPVNYNVDNLTYDNNGNILTMNQYGLKPTGTSSLIDQLSYHYMAQSNKLLNVVDQANDANSTLGDFKYDPNITKTENTVDYTYDGNGNMISDQNKKINNIVYNILNLPSQITIPSKGIIRYYYDATGSKLQKRTLDNTISPSRTTVTNYIGGAVYQNDTLQFFGTLEGRVRANEASTGWLYDYFLKDHLGNTRMMITDDYNVASPILEAYSYYPFGLQQKGIGLIQTGPLHNFKNTFQRQEFNEDLRIDVYEFKYRMDDPQIGRFWQVDPLADKYEYNSTYAFSENKVTSHVELEGLEAKYFLYFLRHPIAASDIGDYQKGSTNISTNSIRFSTRGVDPESGSILQENSSHEGSQVNAFRHTLWQSTITSKYDADLAKSAGDIHEDNPSVDLTIRKFAGKGALDKADQSIDLLNNQIGRSIGEANPKASMNDLASKTLEFFHEKGLYTATINKDGSVTITQTKISDKQYLTLQKVIKTLDQNGFTPQEQKQREITGKQEQERQKLLQTIPPIM